MNEFLRRQRREGISISVLFAIPGFLLSMVAIDVLHTADLGVSQEAFGNLFYAFFSHPLCTAPNRLLKIQQLWLRIQSYYKRALPSTTLNSLTAEMVKRSGKAPRLRAKAAETRHLVPFGVELAAEMAAAQPDSAVYKAMSDMFVHLLAFYNTFGKQPFDKALAASSAKSFCMLYKQLHVHHAPGDLFALKPKFHLFIELAEWQTEEIGDPSRFWCYQDDDFVGWVAKLATSRGGGRSASTTPTNVVARYRALGL